MLFVERYRCMKNNIEGSGTVCKQCLVLREMRGEYLDHLIIVWLEHETDMCVCAMDSTAAQTAEIG